MEDRTGIFADMGIDKLTFSGVLSVLFLAASLFAAFYWVIIPLAQSIISDLKFPW